MLCEHRKAQLLLQRCSFRNCGWVKKTFAQTRQTRFRPFVVPVSACPCNAQLSSPAEIIIQVEENSSRLTPRFDNFVQRCKEVVKY